MAYGYKWKPNKAQVAEFKKQMEELDAFLEEHWHDVKASMSRDSFYFMYNGTPYRVSNHSIEASNKKAYNWRGEQVREKYHPDERDKETRYIHASKTRFIEIYNRIMSGIEVDGHGNAMV